MQLQSWSYSKATQKVPCTDHLHIALKLLCYPALLSSHTCILFTQILVAITMTSKNFSGEMIICQRRLQVITTSKEGKPRVLSCSSCMGLLPWPQTNIQLWCNTVRDETMVCQTNHIFNYTDFFSSPLHTNNWKYIKKSQHKLKFNTVSYNKIQSLSTSAVLHVQSCWALLDYNPTQSGR